MLVEVTGSFVSHFPLRYRIWPFVPECCDIEPVVIMCFFIDVKLSLV